MNPAPTTTSPRIHTTVNDAILICCALAWRGNILTGRDYHTDQVERVVTHTRHSHTSDEILNWRAHTSPGSWDSRWHWARRVTLDQFSDTPGVDDLPTDHTDLHHPTFTPPEPATPILAPHDSAPAVSPPKRRWFQRRQM